MSFTRERCDDGGVKRVICEAHDSIQNKKIEIEIDGFPSLYLLFQSYSFKLTQVIMINGRACQEL